MWLMSAVVLGCLALCVALRRRPAARTIVGALAWTLGIAYFAVELPAVAASAAPYDPLVQPMSDLGVTTCGTGTYPLADYAICSPWHDAVNWAFLLSGLVVALGAWCLHPVGARPGAHRSRRSILAATLLVTWGLSMASSGLFPADTHFWTHTLLAVPGMVVHIPALLVLRAALRDARPGLARWTGICATVSIATLTGVVAAPLVPGLGELGGLLQRLLYAVVWVWTLGVAAATAVTAARSAGAQHGRGT
ncbi:hypothetical protein ACZ91_54405 [Streptomyces regensis]|nr:hypothetical protein ACZ91_54405 [Streptomyces regensis]